MIEHLDQPSGKQTEFLLNSISRRLSGREDCRQVCYRVVIDHTGIRMSPTIHVFPNNRSRKEGDKMEVISFIHHYKMPNALLSDFIFGVYEYQLSVDKKRRKWRKVE